MQTQKRRKQNRLENYNYSWDGYYFVTICTKEKEIFFGEIKNQKMILNKCGEIAKKYWLEIPEHFSYCKLDEFIIMPNHIHGVLIIEGYDAVVGNAYMRSLHDGECDRTKMYLSKIVHGFKASVTRSVRRQYDDCNFGWQKSFYDHIVRNEKSLNRIREYIIINSRDWDKDDDNLHNENI